VIGRAAELATLIDWTTAAALGRGGLVLLDGPAGIGKTHLLHAFREAIEDCEVALATGAYEPFANAPYAGLAQALRQLGVAARRAGGRASPAHDRLLFERLAEATERATAVVLLEDVQAADDASLELLLTLSRCAAALRLLLVATVRSDELHRRHPAAPFFARLAHEPAVRRLELAPLDAGATAALAREAAGPQALAPAQLAAIVARSEGNPFFAEELVAGGYAPRAGGAPAPATVRAAVVRRLSAFDLADRAVLACAAVFGRAFGVELLAAIARCRPRDVVAILSAAAELRLIVDVPGPVPAFAFRHALTREAVQGELLAIELRPLHRRIVEALEAQGADDVTFLGHHAWVARDAARCLRYNERAGDDAVALGAHADALRAYERALDGVTDAAARARLLSKATRCAGAREATRKHAAAVCPRNSSFARS